MSGKRSARVVVEAAPAPDRALAVVNVDRPDDAEVVDLSERTITTGFIDTHVHLTMDASDLARQTLHSSAHKALARTKVLAGRSRGGFPEK
jgi:imidazolonepropionase-like amidohydrolase